MSRRNANKTSTVHTDASNSTKRVQMTETIEIIDLTSEDISVIQPTNTAKLILHVGNYEGSEEGLRKLIVDSQKCPVRSHVSILNFKSTEQTKREIPVIFKRIDENETVNNETDDIYSQAREDDEEQPTRSNSNESYSSFGRLLKRVHRFGF